jgi:heme exporter protein D
MNSHLLAAYLLVYAAGIWTVVVPLWIQSVLRKRRERRAGLDRQQQRRARIAVRVP